MTKDEINCALHERLFGGRILSQEEMREEYERHGGPRGRPANGEYYCKGERFVMDANAKPTRYEQSNIVNRLTPEGASQVRDKIVADGWNITLGNASGEKGWWIVGDHAEVEGAILEVDDECYDRLIARAGLQCAELLAAARASVDPSSSQPRPSDTRGDARSYTAEQLQRIANLRLGPNHSALDAFNAAQTYARNALLHEKLFGVAASAPARGEPTTGNFSTAIQCAKHGASFDDTCPKCYPAASAPTDEGTKV